MTELTKRLEDYGADVSGALERFVDDESLYVDCFTLFLDDPGFAALGDALARKDYSVAFDTAHTLKGISGNLGLTPFFEAICAIVEPLRRGQYQNLDGAYRAVLEAKAALDALRD